jgi:ketosteroid isomerase-like protein
MIQRRELLGNEQLVEVHVHCGSAFYIFSETHGPRHRDPVDLSERACETIALVSAKEDAVNTPLSIVLAALLVATIPVLAQESPRAQSSADTESIHNELRALRDGLVKATNDANIDALLTYLHPNVVVTWQNAEVSRGQAGVRDYLTRMTSGPNRVVRRFQTSPTVDELTILYGGDTGIAFGTSHDRFELTDGMNFDLDGRWSATMVKENGRWLVASFHASSNLFDNAVLRLASRATMWTGMGGLAVGVLLTLVGAVIVRRRQRRAGSA